MSLTGNLRVSVTTELTSSLDKGTATSAESINISMPITSGTGASQGNQVFSDTRTLSASSNEELDLSGSLSNGLGDTVTFTRIIGLVVEAAAANGDTISVGGAAANGFESWVGATGDLVKVRPGGALVLVAKDATGYAVTAGTADLLKIANDDSAAAGDYTIYLIGS
jgi:hypothetical protein